MTPPSDQCVGPGAVLFFYFQREISSLVLFKPFPSGEGDPKGWTSPKPSPWGPTPLVKGRCREATEGIGKLSAVRLTDEGRDKRRRSSQGLPLIRPSVRTGAPSPLWGEGFGAVQIGRNCPLCGTFGYIYWELGQSAPVGGAAQCAAPTAETW